MAKKGKNAYQVTKEKPMGSLGLLVSGGAAGTVFLFLVFLLIGAYSGMSLDNMIFFFLMAGMAGFFLGMGICWLLIRYFGEIVHFAGLAGPVAAAPAAVEAPEAPVAAEEAVPEAVEEENKGKSVDYVFPEFSAENQP